MAKSPNHMAGINSLPKWDPANPLKYTYDPANYDPADYARFKQARINFQAKQPKPPSIKAINKQLNDAINESLKQNAPPKPNPNKHRGSGKGFEADVAGSTCFDALYYSPGLGGVMAHFIGPAAGFWFYPMSRDEARDWFDDDSLGGYFNAEIR